MRPIALYLCLLALAVVAFMPTETLAQSCAMCGSSFTDPNDPTVRAFNWSILMLICAPYLMFGSIGGWIVYKYWHARDRRPASPVAYLAPSQKEGML